MTITRRRQRESGQSEALGWLDAHGDALLSYAIARVPDRETAEDLVQDTFLSVMDGGGLFRGESAIRTWLISILRRKIADHYRALSRRPKAVQLHDQDDTEESSTQHRHRDGYSRAAMADALETDEFWSTLDGCLAKLPKTLAGAFVLRVMDGLDVNELCELLDISPTNLGVRLHRARRGLRDCLTRNWFR